MPFVVQYRVVDKVVRRRAVNTPFMIEFQNETNNCFQISKAHTDWHARRGISLVPFKSLWTLQSIFVREHLRLDLQKISMKKYLNLARLYMGQDIVSKEAD